MRDAVLEVLAVFLLTLCNGLLAMSEIAVLSARKARLQQRAESGDKGARVALELAGTPDRFLSTVQIGITLVGILAGALGGATIADGLGVQLGRIPLLAPYSKALSVAIVVLSITYLSLVIGELVPKRLALNNAERIAASVAVPMKRLSTISAPFVSLLSFSTKAVLRLLRVQPSTEPAVTEEEVRIMIREGTQMGIFEKAERDILEHVFRLGDRRVSALMKHRTEIVWLDIDEPEEEILKKVTTSVHSRFPVARESLDNVHGVVRAKDLLNRHLSACGERRRTTAPIDLKSMLQPPLFVPENMPALQVLERFKESRSHIALVIDEYGGVQGLVTVYDVLEAIVGDIPLKGDVFEPEVVQRKDGSWLVDGILPVDEFKEIFDIKVLPGESEGHFETLGGFVMKFLGRIPTSTDTFTWRGIRFEVVDMDGLRVDKVLVVPAALSKPD